MSEPTDIELAAQSLGITFDMNPRVLTEAQLSFVLSLDLVRMNLDGSSRITPLPAWQAEFWEQALLDRKAALIAEYRRGSLPSTDPLVLSSALLSGVASPGLGEEAKVRMTLEELELHAAELVEMEKLDASVVELHNRRQVLLARRASANLQSTTSLKERKS